MARLRVADELEASQDASRFKLVSSRTQCIDWGWFGQYSVNIYVVLGSNSHKPLETPLGANAVQSTLT